MSESTEQQSIIYWFRLQYPDKIIFAIPNDLKMAYKADNPFAFKAKMKREGLLPGVSDVQVLYVNDSFASLFLELKDNGKTWSDVSVTQRTFLKQAISSGYAGAFAFGFEHAKELITDYMENRLTIQNELLQ